MPVDLSALDLMLPKAIRHFWRSRLSAAASQKRRGVVDAGNRAGVTAGKNMDGFAAMVRDVVVANGIPAEDVKVCAAQRNLPGFFRPAKAWDLLVVSRDCLVAAVEFKSQVGPSFGNNFNNRIEEAVGNAVDLATAFREGALGESSKPFLGYFFLLEECPASTKPVRFKSPHFPAMSEFEMTSYAGRYEIFCRKLVQEQLYDAAALILTGPHASRSGEFAVMSDLTSPRRFAAALAGRVAATTAG